MDMFVALSIAIESDSKSTTHILKEMMQVMISRNNFIKNNKENTDYIRTQCNTLIEKLNHIKQIEIEEYSIKKHLEAIELELHRKLDINHKQLEQAYNKVEFLIKDLKNFMING